MRFETERVEFKVRMVDDIYREVIAFANTEGGTVYIGIDDSGNVVGVDDVDETYTRLTNGVRDAIQPDVTMFIKYKVREDHVIQVTVGEGASKPYYLKSKGLKPSGIFVRQGASTVQASFEQIRQMIKLTDGDAYETMRSLEQDLTFQSAAKAFQKYRVAFSAEKYVALGIQNETGGLYTNLALLLSDQCGHTTKIAVFGDESNTTFKDSREFGGSLFQQMEDSFQYLMLCNRTTATFHGLDRVETRDYPDEAIREALLNALVHRDYSFSGSIIINVNDSWMEFISLGGLLPGLSAEDIRSGISQPRNRKLAEVFHRLHLIESYGTGIRRIYHLYENQAEQPRIDITPNTFKMILPNRNATAPAEEEPKNTGTVTSQMRIILSYLEQHNAVTEEQVQDLLGVKRTRAYTIMRNMRSQGLVIAKGRGKEKVYCRA